MARFEEFGDKHNAYMMQVIVVDGNEYLLDRKGVVHTRAPGLPVLKDKEIVEQVREQATKEGGWSVR